MIEIGKKYKTKQDKNVIIERAFRYENEVIFKGNNGYDYNEKGEAFFVLMFKNHLLGLWESFEECFEVFRLVSLHPQKAINIKPDGVALLFTINDRHRQSVYFYVSKHIGIFEVCQRVGLLG